MNETKGEFAMVRIPHIIFDIQKPNIYKFFRTERIYEPVALVNEQEKIEMLRAVLRCAFG